MIASPLFGITAPVAGAGKSKLAQTIAIVATGCPCPVTALGKKEEEAEKRLCAALIAGDQVIILDNAERPIAGELICQAVTEQYVAVRVFGLLKRIIVPNQTIFLATGNGLRFEGDLSRRTLLIGLDPKCERPELREFEDDDPVLVALRDRPSLVVAALTIVRAFALEGCPREVAPLGSFEDWSKWARDPLVWLGLPDPAEAMNKVRGDDPEGLGLTAVLEHWEVTSVKVV